MFLAVMSCSLCFWCLSDLAIFIDNSVLDSEFLVDPEFIRMQLQVFEGPLAIILTSI